MNLFCVVAEVPEAETVVGRELDHWFLHNKTRYFNNPDQNGLNWFKSLKIANNS